MQQNIEAEKKSGIFKYKEDRWPVCIILLLTLIDIALYFTVDSKLFFFLYYLVMIIPKGKFVPGITTINIYLPSEIIY